MVENNKKPKVSIIIPSWTGDVSRVRRSIEQQTFQDYELQVVTGVSPAARARNVGAQRSNASILLFIDDDAYFGTPHVLGTLVDLIESDPTTAVVGTSKLVPNEATPLQKAIARQVPRMVYPVVHTHEESNPPLNRYGFTAVTTTCCAVRRDVFLQVNGFDEGLTTGPEDTDFFYRVHKKGYKIIVAKDSWVYHDPPASIKDLAKKSFWYGVGHALEARKSPERRMDVLPLDRWYGKLALPLAVLALPFAFFFHIYFDPKRRLAFGFRPLKTLSTYAVLCGYAYGWFRGKPSTPTTTYLGRKRGDTNEYGSLPQHLGLENNSNGNYHEPRNSEDGVLDMSKQNSSPRVSIIIPSWTGQIDRLMKSIEMQTFREYEVQVVKGVSPAGRARNIGVRRTTGEILLFIDDDAYFGTPDALQRLVTILDDDPRVGVAGSSKLVPEGASWVQKAIAQQVPRMVYPVVPTTVESNPPLDSYGYTALTTTCCAVRRDAFEAANGFDEELTRSGEDTDFFYRVHRDNWKLMVAGNCWVYHDPPASIRDLLRKSFWYGTGHALEARKSPERGMAVIPLDKWYGKIGLIGLVLAFPVSLFVHYYFDPVHRLEFGFRPLKTLSTYAVLFGYAYGWFRGKSSTPMTTYLGRKRAQKAEDD